MYVYLGTHASSPAPAIVICPGGGYRLLSIDLEGFAVAKWFQAHGVTAVVLKYRVPDNKVGALQDLERAMRLVRANKTAWNVDASRVGVLGFSAGGNLSARLLAETASSYAPIDATDRLGCRPDFVALIYPAYMGENNAVAADVALHGAVPPLFIAQADDDTKYMPGTKIYEAALTSSKIPHVFLEFKTSGHGFGLGRGESVAWPENFLAYLEQSKILAAASIPHGN
jgi:acetyl esterase/lipase